MSMGRVLVVDDEAKFKQGVVEYLVKPVEAAKLTASVHKAVQEHVLFKDQFAT